MIRKRKIRSGLKVKSAKTNFQFYTSGLGKKLKVALCSVFSNVAAKFRYRNWASPIPSECNNSLNCYQVNLGRRDIRKKGGAGPTCSSEARVGFADRAVEGGYFPSQYVHPYIFIAWLLWVTYKFREELKVWKRMDPPSSQLLYGNTFPDSKKKGMFSETRNYTTVVTEWKKG
ncbi:MAG: hypothetical protein ACE5HR_01635 [bacterium]